MTLEPRRPAKGLIVYNVCVAGDLDCYLEVLELEALLAAIIIAVIAIVLEGGGASLPGPSPAPVPVMASGGVGAGAQDAERIS